MIALILAGGSGKRLWPLSRSLFAKQFITFQSEKSLLQETVEKASKFCNDVVIVTNLSQYFLVKYQVKDLNVNDENIIGEPVGKNTAPAIALGSKFIEEKFGDESVLVMPSDHVLSEKFFELAKEAEKYCKEYICIFGVTPTFPSTGYGYIKKGDSKGIGFISKGFFEKPDKARAEDYLSSGDYLWNSGIFLFKPNKIWQEFKKNLPDLHNYLSSFESFRKKYNEFPNVSIDFGIMEKAKDILVFRFEEGWRDVGSWESVYDILEKDVDGNAIKGDVLALDTNNSLIFGGDRFISAIGLQDMILVDTKDALLAAPRERSEDVKKVVKLLKDEGRAEASLHATVYRPWGYYTLLESGERYKVKRLAIYPGKSISLQLHRHRAEHWIVVKGIAEIIRGDEVVKVHENESIYVPKSTKHRVKNHGDVDLQIIETQTGEYIEEDDIERFDDEYGRV
jgi:mannose-1-phosphate guanylyltransferase/mannose-6-phosphate isomerase